ncbi:DUF6988 family protein [Novilysobacter avium]|uniref:Uncharacterized protein n=1 Tax=Novilysobacter avium TaxID=2781023 RepID=A0A7S6UMN3_9GAMM|nr:hypothetical protein [Lysobacter avium]QOW22996.1 hypothetical protein INQ42_05415 [Lysobacter avium]
MRNEVAQTRSDTDGIDRLDGVRFGTHALHQALCPLWDDLPEPSSARELAVRGFANIVRQHAMAQWVLVQRELDVSATALVRPTYEALVRVVWTLRGADDSWIEGFFSPTKDALKSHAETRKGPDVAAMLAVIERYHPAEIFQPLLSLKEHTWRAMHSYVHSGIRPVVQSFVVFPADEAASLLINANGMLMLATNAVRIAHRLRSPMLPELQRQYADCLPNPC